LIGTNAMPSKKNQAIANWKDINGKHLDNPKPKEVVVESKKKFDTEQAKTIMIAMTMFLQIIILLKIFNLI